MMFNDALSKAAEIVLQHLGDPNRRVVLVRDLFGKFRVVLPDDRVGGADTLAAELTGALGVYGYTATSTFLRESDVGTAAKYARVILEGEDRAQVVLVDRLLMGTEWSDPPVDLASGPKRFTLFSMKGGVGRSTTAAVLAHHLASRGKRVLVFDLDLESPGIGSTLLGDTLPQFGIVDWFVEDALGQGDAVVDRLHANSPLATANGGQIIVAPAFGSDTGDYLAKLGRVYLERGPSGPESWTKRLGRFVSTVEDRLGPHVVLLDSRTGLHDTSAALVLAMGADTLMFAVDTPQTWAAYSFLFRHWNTHPQISQFRDRFRVIASLVPGDRGLDYLNKFGDRAYELFLDTLYEEEADGAAPVDPLATPAFSFGPRDEGAPHCASHITWHPGLTAFAPLNQFNEGAVTAAYTSFLNWFDLTWSLEVP